MRRDLEATANANSGARVIEAGRVGLPSTVESAFRAHLSTSVFSTNAAADKILAFDEISEITHMRGLCIHWAGGDARAGLAYYKVRQERWYRRRTAFEKLWKRGRSLLYGAVNSGNLGVYAHGGFCLVVEDPTRLPKAEWALFPGNSAKRYATLAGKPRTAKAVKEATAWKDRAELAIVKLGSSIETTHPAGWPELICRKSDFIEVAQIGGIPISAITEIRVGAANWKKLMDGVARKRRKLPLDAGTAMDVKAADAIIGWGVKIVRVP